MKSKDLNYIVKLEKAPGTEVAHCAIHVVTEPKGLCIEARQNDRPQSEEKACKGPVAYDNFAVLGIEHPNHRDELGAKDDDHGQLSDKVGPPA